MEALALLLVLVVFYFALSGALYGFDMRRRIGWLRRFWLVRIRRRCYCGRRLDAQYRCPAPM